MAFSCNIPPNGGKNVIGFDSFYGSFNGDIDCLRKTNQAREPDWHRNERPIQEEGYCTTLIGKEAARIIDKHDTAKPLFRYLSFNAPQAPLRATMPYLDMYKEVRDEQRRTYAAMVTQLDDAIVTVLPALDRKAITTNALIVYSRLPVRYELYNVNDDPAEEDNPARP